MIKGIRLTIIVFFVFASCKPQTKNQIIYKVTQDVLTSIQNNDVEKFKSLIGNDNIKKDTELISFNVNRLSKLLNESYNNQQGKPLIEITERYNFWGNCVLRSQSIKSKRLAYTRCTLIYCLGRRAFFH